MLNYIDKSYFNELSRRSPQDICKIISCQYDIEKKRYIVSVWGDHYEIYPDQLIIENINKTGSFSHPLFKLFILYYLLNVKPIDITNEWVSEKDLPSGAAFFRGPHTIPTHLITERYQNDTRSFNQKCKKLGGISINMADTSYRFDITPKIPVAILYWEGDEDFPPEAKLLFDKTICEHLTLDIIFSLSLEICFRIAEKVH